MLDILKDVLEHEGHTVETASDGQAGLDSFRVAREAGQPFDTVLTDLNMPGLRGDSVAARIKQESPATLVVMLTGLAPCLTAEATTSRAIDYLLTKPVTISELRRVLLQ